MTFEEFSKLKNKEKWKPIATSDLMNGMKKGTFDVLDIFSHKREFIIVHIIDKECEIRRCENLKIMLNDLLQMYFKCTYERANLKSR